MLEAATAGAKVLHNRAVSLAKKYRLNLNVRNTRGEDTGTSVINNVDEKTHAKILAIQKELAKLTIVGNQLYSNTNYLHDIYEIAKKESIQIYMLSVSEVSINIIVKQSDVETMLNSLHDKLQ